jgi:hypothetical protein
MSDSNNLRPTVRRAGERKGRLYVPESLKMPGYRYRFVKYSKEQPYRIEDKLDAGWELVPVSEAEALGKRVFKHDDGVKADGGYVVKPLNDKEVYYLCKIPVELYNEIQKEKQDDLRKKEIDMLHAGKKPGFYGDIAQNKESFFTGEDK